MPPELLPSDFAGALDGARAAGRFGRLGSRVLFFSVVGSTNDVAMALATAGDHEGTVVIADAQTSGRGRRGRRWFSPPATGLYVSIVVAPGRARTAPDRATALVTLAAGVALSEAIESLTGLRPDIKWPNDLVIGRRKLAGILAEGCVCEGRSRAQQVTSVVVGFGINVGPMASPSHLVDCATSLELELGRPIDRATLCAETLASVAARYDDLLEGRFDAILDAWRERAPSSRGARVVWNLVDGPQTGITQGIDDSGALLVRVGNQVERVVAGELTWR